jgi:hypothetical protein
MLGNKGLSATASSRREREAESRPKPQCHHQRQPEPEPKGEADLDAEPLEIEPLQVDIPDDRIMMKIFNKRSMRMKSCRRLNLRQRMRRRL